MVFEIGDAFAVAAKRAGREEAVAAGLDQIGTAGSECRYRNESGLGMNVIAAEEIDSIEFVGRDQALNLVEDRKRIEGTDAGIESQSGEPD